MVFFCYGFLPTVLEAVSEAARKKQMHFFKNRTIAIKLHSFFSNDRFNTPKIYTLILCYKYLNTHKVRAKNKI